MNFYSNLSCSISIKPNLSVCNICPAVKYVMEHGWVRVLTVFADDCIDFVADCAIIKSLAIAKLFTQLNIIHKTVCIGGFSVKKIYKKISFQEDFFSRAFHVCFEFLFFVNLDFKILTLSENYAWVVLFYYWLWTIGLARPGWCGWFYHISDTKCNTFYK